MNSTVNIAFSLTRNARIIPNKIALIDSGGTRITYRELDCATNRLAHALKKMGIRKGDHVATLFPNCIDQIQTLYGLLKIGAVSVVLNARLGVDELQDLLRRSDAIALFYHKNFANQIDIIRSRLPKIVHYVICPKEGQGSETMDLSQLLNQEEDGDLAVSVKGKDPAFMVFTTGTTGSPKGVLLTHESCLWNAINYSMAGLSNAYDINLQFLPLYHVAALGGTLAHILLGAITILKSHFSAAECMDIIKREKVNRMGIVPTMYTLISELPGLDSYNTQSLKILVSGSAFLPVAMKTRIRQTFPAAGIYDIYGMTEGSGGITVLTAIDSERKLASVGRPFIGVELRVVDEKDQDVPAGEMGEILFRGYNLMKGYYRDRSATAKALRGGWMHTGDIGRLDEEGYLYIMDRKKDIIISGGENVFPSEVERRLLSHPKILEAAVIGVPDERWGEVIRAHVALKMGETMDEADVIGFCKEKMVGYKCPKSVRFLESLPKNSTGKISKVDLRILEESKDEGTGGSLRKY